MDAQPGHGMEIWGGGLLPSSAVPTSPLHPLTPKLQFFRSVANHQKTIWIPVLSWLADLTQLDLELFFLPCAKFVTIISQLSMLCPMTKPQESPYAFPLNSMFLNTSNNRPMNRGQDQG